MNKFYSYINSAIYNIRHNKAYAAFCIFGTALTFIFISIVLQLTNDVVNNTAPFVNTDREIFLGDNFKNEKGGGIGGILHNEIPLFLNNLKGYELCALRYKQLGIVSVNNKFTSTTVITLVNGDYWMSSEFDFIAGRSFTEEEVAAKTPVAVVRKSFAESNFKTDEILGQKIEFQDVTYTVIGVVDEYNNIINGGDEVWIPHTFNSFAPDAWPYYHLYILPEKVVAIDDFKDNVVAALKFYFQNKSINVDIDRDDIFTRQEVRLRNYGYNVLSYGIPIVLLVLLLIPAINIVVISIANINNRAKEIAIRRSMGATILSSFILILIENLLLVIIGTIIGVILAVPTTNLINSLFFNDGIRADLSLITEIDFFVLILGIIPLSLLFTLFSGGLPAYLVSKGKISRILKEDFSKNGNSIKRFSGIFIQQVLVFIILMLCVVSISIAIDKYNEPGLLDTENVINFGYSAINNSADNLDEVGRDMDILIEKLRNNTNVKAIAEDYMFVPYTRSNCASDSVTIGKTKIKVFTKFTDKYAKSLYNLELLEGDWITDEKLSDGSWSVVITKDISDTLKWDKSVGKKLSVHNRNFTVVGVIAGFKHYGPFSQSESTIVFPIKSKNSFHGSYREVSVKVYNIDMFTVDFYKEWNKLMKNRGVALFFDDLDKAKNSSMQGKTIGIVFQAIPTLFLLIFAFIGTFGIFWLTSQKRIKEFALRIAIGSTPKGLTWLVIKESIIITTLAMIPGLLLSIFIYEGEFTVIHFIAIGITVILMLLFSIFSAWYPAYTVSKINPAKAIKYE